MATSTDSLEKSLGEATQRPTDVILVLDGSGSMETAFPLARVCLRNILQRIPVSSTLCRVALVQFASTAKIEPIAGVPGFSSDIKAIESSINAMTLLNSGTSFTEALKVCSSLFTTGRSGVSKLIVFCTDGNDNQSFRSSVEKVTLEGAEIIPIGVGSGVNRKSLELLSTHYASVVIDTFDALSRYFSSAGAMKNLRPQAKVIERGFNWLKVEVTFPVACHGYEFELFDSAKKNLKNKDAMFIKEFCFERLPNPDEPNTEIIIKDLPSSTKVDLRFCAFLDEDCTVKSNFGFIKDTTAVVPKNLMELSKALKDGTLDATVNKLIKEIVDFKTPKLTNRELEAIRLVILGFMGNGKTTLINTFNTAMHRRFAQFGNTGASLVSLTAKISKLDLKKAGSDELVPVFVYDSFGWDNSNYLDLLWKLLRTARADQAEDETLKQKIAAVGKGSAPVSSAPTTADSELDYTKGLDMKEPIDFFVSKHGVILTFRANDMANASAMNSLSTQIRAIKRVSGNIPVLLAVTHMDSHETDPGQTIAASTKNLLDLEALGNIISTISLETGIHADSMRIVLPYHVGVKECDPIKDFLILSLVKDLMTLAYSFIETVATAEGSLSRSGGIKVTEDDGVEDRAAEVAKNLELIKKKFDAYDKMK